MLQSSYHLLSFDKLLVEVKFKWINGTKLDFILEFVLKLSFFMFEQLLMCRTISLICFYAPRHELPLPRFCGDPKGDIDLPDKIRELEGLDVMGYTMIYLVFRVSTGRISHPELTARIHDPRFDAFQLGNLSPSNSRLTSYALDWRIPRNKKAGCAPCLCKHHHHLPPALHDSLVKMQSSQAWTGLVYLHSIFL